MINYELINKAVTHYTGCLYKYIEVPWLVPESVDSITRPHGLEGMTVESKNKNLIASGEQGFLYLMLKGFLPPGLYQTVTPCFRDEMYDITHSKFFMKNELIYIPHPHSENTTSDMAQGMAIEAISFFKTILPEPEGLEKVDTKDGIDVLYKGVEIGSYGARKYKHLDWAYGTGLAEPRMSNLILQINGIPQKDNN